MQNTFIKNISRSYFVLNPYDIEIDKQIIRCLATSDVGYLSNKELKANVERSAGVNRILSDDTFNSHLKKLLNRNLKIIEKKYDENRNPPNKIFYFLTSYGKYRWHLQLPLLKSISSYGSTPKRGKGSFSKGTLGIINAETELMNEEKKAEYMEHAYNLFFTFAAFNPHNISYFVGKKANLIKLLSRIGKTIENLEVYTTRSSEIQITTYFRSISEITIRETRDLRSNMSYYYCELPGASIREFLDEIRIGNIFSHLRYNEKDVRNYLHYISEEQTDSNLRLIKRFKSPLTDEIRYLIANKSLNDLIVDAWTMFGTVMLRVGYVWKYVRSPKSTEREWHERLYGINYTKQYFSECYGIRTNMTNNTIDPVTKTRYFNSNIERDNYLNDMRKLIISFDCELRNRYSVIKTKYRDVIEKYAFITSYLLRELIYPEFLRIEHKMLC